MKNQEWTRLSVCGDSHTLFSFFPSISACSTCNIWRIQGDSEIQAFALFLDFFRLKTCSVIHATLFSPNAFWEACHNYSCSFGSVLKKKMFSSNGWKISNATFIHFLKCVCFLFHKVEWLDSKGLSFPGGTSGKEPICQCRKCRRPRFDPWIIRKIPWRREWQPTPVFLPEEYHGKRSLADCNP